MKKQFVTIAELGYDHAHYLKNELQIENITAIIDFSVSDGVPNEMNKVKLQVQDENVKDAIIILFMISEQQGQNPLKEINTSNYNDTPLILIPVDFEDHSLALGKYAITLAKKISANIKFLHVYYNSNEAYSGASYEDYQQTVQVQEEHKAKLKMLAFSETIHNYANSVNFPSRSIHFGLSGGNVIDQICNVADKCSAKMILLGPEDITDDDYQIGVVRKTVLKSNIPVLSLPLKKIDPASSIDKVIYFTDDVNKVVAYQKAIAMIFSKSVSCTLLYSNNIKAEDLPEFDINFNLEIIPADTLTMNIIDYLNTSATSLLVFDNPKTGLIERIFGNDLFKELMKQEEFPVLFLK